MNRSARNLIRATAFAPLAVALAGLAAPALADTGRPAGPGPGGLPDVPGAVAGLTRSVDQTAGGLGLTNPAAAGYRVRAADPEPLGHVRVGLPRRLASSLGVPGDPSVPVTLPALPGASVPSLDPNDAAAALAPKGLAGSKALTTAKGLTSANGLPAADGLTASAGVLAPVTRLGRPADRMATTAGNTDDDDAVTAPAGPLSLPVVPDTLSQIVPPMHLPAAHRVRNETGPLDGVVTGLTGATGGLPVALPGTPRLPISAQRLPISAQRRPADAPGGAGGVLTTLDNVVGVVRGLPGSVPGAPGLPGGRLLPAGARTRTTTPPVPGAAVLNQVTGAVRGLPVHLPGLPAGLPAATADNGSDDRVRASNDPIGNVLDGLANGGNTLSATAPHGQLLPAALQVPTPGGVLNGHRARTARLARPASPLPVPVPVVDNVLNRLNGPSAPAAVGLPVGLNRAKTA